MTPKLLYETALQIFAESSLNGYESPDFADAIGSEGSDIINSEELYKFNWESWKDINKNDLDVIGNLWISLSEKRRIAYLDLAIKFLQAQAISGS